LLTFNAGWIHYSKADLLVWAMFENEKLKKVFIYDYKRLKNWWLKKCIFYDWKSLRLAKRGKGLTLIQLIPFQDIKQFLFKESKKIVCPKCGGDIKQVREDWVECQTCFYEFYTEEGASP